MSIIELCAGYGGLAKAVEAITGEHTDYVAEIHPAACKVLAQRFPDAINLGNIDQIDWTEVMSPETPTIISAGFP
jgi:DNA (cytosine-5)-methyltransferase 1